MLEFCGFAANDADVFQICAHALCNGQYTHWVHAVCFHLSVRPRELRQIRFDGVQSSWSTTPWRRVDQDHGVVSIEQCVHEIEASDTEVHDMHMFWNGPI